MKIVSVCLFFLSYFSFSSTQTLPLFDLAGVSYRVDVSSKAQSLEVKIGKNRLSQKLDSNGRILSEKFDRNGNDRYEYQADFSKPNSAILKFDDNEDGFFERVEKRWTSQNKTEALIETFANDGKLLHRRFVVSRPHSSPIIECTPQDSDYAFMKSNKELGALLDEARIINREGPWITTSFGVKIHNSCFQKNIDIINLVQSSWADGLACLNRLGGRGSQEQIAKVAALLANSQNPPKVDCLETDEEITGSGSIPGMPDHPSIGLNITTTPTSRERLKSTLFHELMHNCGQLHGADIEYAYNCPNCCFNSPNSEMSRPRRERHQMSCQICKGDFEGINDPEYTKLIRKMHSVFPDPGTEAFLQSSLYSTTLPQEDRLLNFMISLQNNAEDSALYRVLYERLKHRIPELEAQGLQLVTPKTNRRNTTHSPEVLGQAQKAVEALEAITRFDGLQIGPLYSELRQSLAPTAGADQKTEYEKAQLLQTMNQVYDDLLRFIDKTNQQSQ